MRLAKNKAVKNTYLVLLLFVCLVTGFDTLVSVVSGKRQTTLSDSEGYYMYLPALFIYDGFENYPSRTKGWFPRAEKTGKAYNKYTFGTAILQAPLFLVAHAVALRLENFPADGYSLPYQISVWLSGFLFTLFGLFLLNSYMKRKGYAAFVRRLVLLCLYFGTNLFYYSTAEAGMSHAYSFFLFSALLYLSERFYKKTDRIVVLLILLIVGLIVFIRPTNILIVVFLAFYDVNHLEQLLPRIKWWLRHWSIPALMPLLFLILGSIQIAIWSDVQGQFTLYSYHKEPGFIYWTSPKIWKVLFDVQNGLFIYAPVMLLSIFGLIKGIWNKTTNFLLIGLLFLVVTYVFASWWVWWFGGAFGHRCYIEYFALLALPLAFFISYIMRQRQMWSKIVLLLFILLASYYTTGMANRYYSPWDGAEWTWQKYWSIVETLF